MQPVCVRHAKNETGCAGPQHPTLTLRPANMCQDDGVLVKERYLGLHMPGEEGVPSDYIARLAELLENNVDMDALVAIAKSAQPPRPPADAVPRPVAAPDDAVSIAVAQDAAFGFYYQE